MIESGMCNTFRLRMERKVSVGAMAKKGKSKRKSKKEKSGNADIWTEEEYDEYMRGLYGMSFIAGYTSNGVPYGTFLHEVDENGELLDKAESYDDHDHNPFDDYEDIPF